MSGADVFHGCYAHHILVGGVLHLLGLHAGVPFNENYLFRDNAIQKFTIRVTWRVAKLVSRHCEMARY